MECVRKEHSLCEQEWESLVRAAALCVRCGFGSRKRGRGLKSRLSARTPSARALRAPAARSAGRACEQSVVAHLEAGRHGVIELKHLLPGGAHATSDGRER